MNPRQDGITGLPLCQLVLFTTGDQNCVPWAESELCASCFHIFKYLERLKKKTKKTMKCLITHENYIEICVCH